MRMKLFLLMLFILPNCHAWEATVTEILQHGSYVAVTLSPNPGVGNCVQGSPYLLLVDGTPDKNQKFSMLLTVMASGMTVGGYNDACSSAIWGVSRPTIERLYLKK